MSETMEEIRTDAALIATHPDVLRLIRAALDEDVGTGDVTVQALMDAGRTASALLVAREPMVLAGSMVAARVFHEIDATIMIHLLRQDGEECPPGTALMRVEGPAASLLTAERTALNFLQRCCGIATSTRRYVACARGRVKILDTRKTTPGWRALEKYAVRAGGGHNHRTGLYDRVLIKDNHLAHLRHGGSASLATAIHRAREMFPTLLVEIEADTFDQVHEALPARPDWILLDNMSLEQLRQAAGLCRGICLTEASGGITLDTLDGIADTGVDAVSIGALTHGARAVDIGMDFEEENA